MSCLGVIPARYQSKRFPGKVLAPVQGKPLLYWVYERASKCSLLDSVIVATDDDRVVQAAKKIGAPVQLTSPHCRSGSDRVAEILRGTDYSTVLNIQVDYPDIAPEDLGRVVKFLQDNPDRPMVTLQQPFENSGDLQSPHHVKVYCDPKGRAHKFSREVSAEETLGDPQEHIGIYGFQREALLQFSKWEQSSGEKNGRLEQLRAMDNGMTILVLKATQRCHGINIPEDIPHLSKLR
ncbi:MAG: 3-deoxy-manno-octulosonate cytidylyltransferase [bacterium]|nr:3-deoxy-manno-octulosonate cytidylyltransferase [bacterium]